MSENRETEETLLPDDADRKIEELMAALRESEREMMGDEAEPQEAAEAAGEAEFEEDFLDDEEGDFVDLDAEQLDNSADKLELDESDAVEDELLDQLTASVTPSEEELRAQAALELQHDREAEQRALEANELARARMDELEEKLAAVEAKPLQARPPSGDSRAAKVAALLALLAVVISGAALWLNFNSAQPQPAAAPVKPQEAADKQAMQSLRADIKALRERLESVEKQTEVGSDEAMATLDRMQAVLARMERRLIERAAASVSATPEQVQAPAAKPQPEPIEQTSEETPPVEESASAGAAAEMPQDATAPSSGKVFIKGWAVNLRSFYHRKDAERLMQRYRDEGIAAEIREIPKGKVTWHRVRVMGFDSKEAANAFIDGLSVEQGREMAWPSHYAGYVDG